MSQQQDQAGSAAPDPADDPRYSSVISTRPLPLSFKRPPPWNRWFHKAIHYWRYGYSHPDEDLLGVIDAVGDALHVQVITAKALLTGERAAEADRINDEMEKELKKRPPDFSTLLAMESRINALYPPALARRRQWVIRERFERIASPGAFQYWQVAKLRAGAAEQASAQQAAADGAQAQAQAADDAASGAKTPAATGGGGGGGGGGGAPPGGGSGGGQTGGGGPDDPIPGTSVSESEADSQTLLAYIHTSYLMTIGREKAVRDLKRWLLMRFLLFLFWLVVILVGISGILSGTHVLDAYGIKDYWPLILGLFLVAAVGRAGATMSVIRRLQNAVADNVLAADPIIELTALRTGKNEISLALLSSSVFALLLYAFFLSGIPGMIGLHGGIFPEPALARSTDSATGTPQVQTASADTADTGAAPEAKNETAATDNEVQAVDDAAAQNGAAPQAGADNVVTPQPAPAAAPAAAPAQKASEQAPKPAEAADCKSCKAIDDVRSALGLKETADFFKLLIWAFIAGFAERFVPDVLDRVVSRAQGAAGSDAGALLAAQAGARAAPGPSPPPPRRDAPAGDDQHSGP